MQDHDSVSLFRFAGCVLITVYNRLPAWSDYEPNPPANSSLSNPLSYYAGTYSHPGYGNFTLCVPSGYQASEYCRNVVSSFAIIDAAKNQNTEQFSRGKEKGDGEEIDVHVADLALEEQQRGQYQAPPRQLHHLPQQPQQSRQLVASWPRLFSSHLRLYHYDRNLFTMSSPPTLFLKGYGRDSTPFQLTGPQGQEIYVHFTTDDRIIMPGRPVDGVGVFESLEEATRPEKPGDKLKDRAYVWFKKVS